MSYGISYDTFPREAPKQPKIKYHAMDTDSIDFWHQLPILFKSNAQYALKTLRLDKVSKMYLCGGFFSSIAHNKPINDIDLFFTDDVTFQAVARHMVSMSYTGSNKTKYHNGRVYNYTPNSKSGDVFSQCEVELIQLPNLTSIEEILKDFDMVQCAVGYDSIFDTLYSSEQTLQCIASKEIIMREKSLNGDNSENTIERAKKYIKSKGFSICRSQAHLV